MAKQIACGDVVTGCSFVTTGETEADVLQKVVKHAAEVHGITEITPELAEQVKSKIRDVPAGD